ncbi:MAG: nicotinate phosphoribosyltransferase [Aquificae bacterium]|nr:nicotinate phosphoribosyltransferase [Aquificota bacterium]
MTRLGLYTDLYEFTMAQVYLKEGKTANAVFSLFVRKLPEQRNFLVNAGLATFLERLERFRFGDEELKFLRSTGLFEEWFLDYLREFEFKGKLYAVDEGRVVFQNEPVLQVEASLPEAQLLETLAINTFHLQTVIASKAVRCVLAARGRRVVDFGLRRAHGLEAGLYGARSCYLTGFYGSSNLEACRRFGIPPVGTMAHSFVMVFGEEEAFKAFARSYPNNAVFLVDTYDPIKAVRKVIKLAREGYPVLGIRVDSGDVAALVPELRRLLDEAGLKEVKIIVSGGVDEYAIDDWLSKGVPVDAFGVGTKVLTSADAPYLDMAYKLVEYDGRPTYKLSPGKRTFPYKRQVYRYYRDGKAVYDEVVPFNQKRDGEPLVKEVTSPPSLKEARELLNEELRRLPDELKRLEKARYEVRVV